MRAYKVVDAFTSTPFKGNPVAVVLDGKGLTDEQMQHFAGWTNLSETTFVLPATQAGADYQLRIFTPRSELPFAGHPTLGSAHAILEAGLAEPSKQGGILVQQCKQGLVKIAVQQDSADRKLVLELPAAKERTLDEGEVNELESVLGVKVVRAAAPAVIDVGPHWVIAQIESAEALISLEPDFARMAKFERRTGVTGITLFGEHKEGDKADIEVRSFAPSDNIEEDPVCGSGNGSVAVFRSKRGHFQSGKDAFYKATQGRRLGREGEISVGVYADGRITIGGSCVTCVEGKVEI